MQDLETYCDTSSYGENQNQTFWQIIDGGLFGLLTDAHVSFWLSLSCCKESLLILNGKNINSTSRYLSMDFSSANSSNLKAAGYAAILVALKKYSNVIRTFFHLQSSFVN